MVVEEFYLRHRVAWRRLRDILAAIYGLTPAAIAGPDFEDQAAAEIAPHPTRTNDISLGVQLRIIAHGLPLRATLYPRAVPPDAPRGIALAQRVAAALGADVVTSPEGEAALSDRWILATPDGALFRVDEETPDAPDGELHLDWTSARRV